MGCTYLFLMPSGSLSCNFQQSIDSIKPYRRGQRSVMCYVSSYLNFDLRTSRNSRTCDPVEIDPWSCLGRVIHKLLFRTARFAQHSVGSLHALQAKICSEIMPFWHTHHVHLFHCVQKHRTAINAIYIIQDSNFFFCVLTVMRTRETFCRLGF